MNTINNVNLTNWNYSYYNSEFFKAMISFTGVPVGENDMKFVYSPTVLDKEEKEVFQMDFDTLEEAISYLNSSYSHWTFIDPLIKTGGCSSCAAH